MQRRMMVWKRPKPTNFNSALDNNNNNERVQTGGEYAAVESKQQWENGGVEWKMVLGYGIIILDGESGSKRRREGTQVVFGELKGKMRWLGIKW